MCELTPLIRSIRERIINYYHIDRVRNGVGEIVRGFRANYRELVELCCLKNIFKNKKQGLLKKYILIKRIYLKHGGQNAGKAKIRSNLGSPNS